MKRSLLSTIALGVSAGAKFLPILAFPFLARRVKARFHPVPFAVLAAIYLESRRAGSRYGVGSEALTCQAAWARPQSSLCATMTRLSDKK